MKDVYTYIRIQWTQAACTEGRGRTGDWNRNLRHGNQICQQEWVVSDANKYSVRKQRGRIFISDLVEGEGGAIKDDNLATEFQTRAPL